MIKTSATAGRRWCFFQWWFEFYKYDILILTFFRLSSLKLLTVFKGRSGFKSTLIFIKSPMNKLMNTA